MTNSASVRSDVALNNLVSASSFMFKQIFMLEWSRRGWSYTQEVFKDDAVQASMLCSHHHPCHPRRPISDRLAGPRSCCDPAKLPRWLQSMEASREARGGGMRARFCISCRRPREWHVPATAQGKMMIHGKRRRRYGRNSLPFIPQNGRRSLPSN